MLGPAWVETERLPIGEFRGRMVHEHLRDKNTSSPQLEPEFLLLSKLVVK